MSMFSPGLARISRRHSLAALAGAGTAVAFCGRARAAEPLRIATNPTDPSAEPFYALDRGFFRDAGIDAQISVMTSGPAVAAAVAANSIDIGGDNLLSLALAIKQNAPLTAVAPSSYYYADNPTSVLMVPKDSPVRTASDLNGKTFGTLGIRSITEFVSRLWMDKNGGDSTTVKFIELSVPLTVSALAAKRIDAAIVVEPFITIAKERGAARILADAFDVVAPKFLVGTWMSTSAWARAHPDMAARFLGVIARTAEWANAHPDETAAILMKYGKLDPRIMKMMHRARFATRFNPAEMQPILDLAARYGALPASFSAQDVVWKA